MSGRHLGAQVSGDRQRGNGSTGESPVAQRRPALWGGDQLVDQLGGAVEHLRAGDALGQEGGRPRDDVSAHPVGALLPRSCDRCVGGGDGELMGGRIVGEGHKVVRFRRKLVVVATGHPVLPVVFTPGSTDGHLDFVGAFGQGGRRVRVCAVPDRFHQRRRAVGLPVIGASQSLLEGSGKRDHAIAHRVPHAVGRPVVVEGHLGGRLQGVGDVRPVGRAAASEGNVPRSALGDLVFVLAGGQREGPGVDAGRLAGQSRLLTPRGPVGVASHGLVVAAGDCHQRFICRRFCARLDGRCDRCGVGGVGLRRCPRRRQRCPHERYDGANAQGATQQRPGVSVCHERLPRP